MDIFTITMLVYFTLLIGTVVIIAGKIFWGWEYFSWWVIAPVVVLLIIAAVVLYGLLFGTGPQG